MKETAGPEVIRFGVFEVDSRAGELRKNGLKLKLAGQPFEFLLLLLERPGEVITREEIQKRLWPADTFVDFEHGINTAVKRVREALGDSAESPRFVQTLHRRGYRFIARASGAGGTSPAEHPQAQPVARALTRLTFDAGLQLGATWSPDGRFLAYSADRVGKFDIWVQPVGEGDAVQVTKGPGHNWQPDWSPDGKLIAFRSERGQGGLYVVPALGGSERRIASFGYRPRWSPDGSQVLFATAFSEAVASAGLNRLHVVTLHGGPPREILSALLRRNDFRPLAAVWHPDGKRVSVGALDWGPGPSFWTVPLDGGSVVKSETTREAADQMADAGNKSLALPAVGRFAWAPSGKAVYIEHKSGGSINLWRLTIDPETLKVTGVERLTTGAGRDAEFALSPDGTKLAFTAKVQQTCVWVFPFDASAGRILAAGHAVSSPGMAACEPTLSPDGRKLAFCVERAGNWELRAKSLPEGDEAPVIAGDYFRTHPVWSPDARRLAYMRIDPSTWRGGICLWSAASREEEPLVVPGLASAKVCPFDWSPDGKSLLVGGSVSADKPEMGIWQLSIEGVADAKSALRQIAYDPTYSLYQAHFSPDGRWIVFEGTRNAPNSPESNLYVIPASGGPWTRITDGKDWADKPRWSPDGKVIYFLSGRSGFFDVWGIRFNPVEGRTLGEPFRMTSFDSPGLGVSEPISLAGLSVSHNHLALTLTEVSGSIWMLDNVGR